MLPPARRAGVRVPEVNRFYGIVILFFHKLWNALFI